MALTVCGACDKTYLESKNACSHCGKTSKEQIAFVEGQLKAIKAYGKESTKTITKVLSGNITPEHIKAFFGKDS